jgi:hypothetical protein
MRSKIIDKNKHLRLFWHYVDDAEENYFLTLTADEIGSRSGQLVVLGLELRVGELGSRIRSAQLENFRFYAGTGLKVEEECRKFGHRSESARVSVCTE